MRIKGRRDLQDYFDSIGYQFGIDPLITYVREPFTPIGADRYVRRRISDRCARYLVFNLLESKWSSTPEWRSISYVVAGKWCFPVISKDYLLGKERSRGEELLKLPDHAPFLKKDFPSEKPRFPCPPPEDVMEELIRAVGAPVFRVIEVNCLDWRSSPMKYEAVLHPQIPHLGTLGVSKVVPPTQMWQEIYRVMSSVLRDDPDKMPPVEISNENRIHTAGFDLNTSFRHPIK